MNFNLIEGLSEQEIISIYDDVAEKDSMAGCAWAVYCRDGAFGRTSAVWACAWETAQTCSTFNTSSNTPYTQGWGSGAGGEICKRQDQYPARMCPCNPDCYW